MEELTIERLERWSSLLTL